ncbi:polygalacturonase PglB [Martelella mangrovi]|uniref:Polygalacturonase n=1 Tax=Martelella mangrovi TaxID=1397477 RepID=A0ABV2I7X3_9HYPH
MPKLREIRIPAETTPATARIQQAIDTAATGPVRVILETGRHKSAGLVLRSDVELRLEKNAELCFDADYDSYGRVFVFAEESDRAMISASGASRIALTGQGRIMADSAAFVTGDDAEMGTRIPARFRPRLLVLDGCSDVSLSGITVTNSPMWTLHFVNCTHVSVHAVRVDNDRRMPNTDGIVIDACRDVRIAECDISTADDGIVLKTSLRDDGRIAGTCERVTVTACRVLSRSCALKVGTESFGAFRELTFEDCDIIDSNRGLGIFSRDGGTVEHVRFSNIRLECRETPAGFWGSGEALTINSIDRRPETRPAGKISDIVAENITGTMEGAINLYAECEGGIENVTIRNVSLRQAPGVFGTARAYDLRPTPADLETAPDEAGRANAWRKGPDGRVIGLVDYPGGMPVLFARNIAGLTCDNVTIERPVPLPPGFNDRSMLIVDSPEQ